MFLSEDYAMRAAQEWLEDTPAIDYKGCSCLSCSAKCKWYDKRLELLAAIIRKHVTEYKLRLYDVEGES